MSRYSPTRLFKNRAEGKFLGVCAGIGDYFDISHLVIRVLTILSLFTPVSFATVVGYFLLAFILPDKPRELTQDPEADRFWRDVRNKPETTMVSIRERFRDLERRTASLEAYMTSDRYRLDKELEELKKGA